MAEINKTLAILKARWPEATLIVSLNVVSLFVNKLHLMMKPKISPIQTTIGLGSLLVFIVIMVIVLLLTIGFQRTIYLEGNKRQSPKVLLQMGKHFFGRIVAFGLIYIPVFWILAWLTFLAIKQFISIETGFLETAKVAPLVYQLCFTTATLILIKPLLLIFPLIVVLDCRISKSFKLLKQCKLLNARELIMLFLISMAVIFLRVFLPSIKSATTISQYILIVAWSAIQHFIGLMIAVMAIRFVASLNLVYDSKPSSLDLEESRK
jgi:hypothetical protein